MGGIFTWRYRWDLNPRWALTHTTFRELHLRPLGHGTGREFSTRRPYARTVEILLIVVGALAIAAVAVAGWVRWLSRRQGRWRVRLSDRIPVHSKFWRDRANEEGDLLYVAMGDSAAQGIGASRPDHSYVGFLVRHLQSHTNRTVRVANLAISGATVRRAIDEQLPRLAKLQPDILTICIGANDIRAFDERRFEREIAEVFDALPPHAIVADLPSFYFLPSQKRVHAANRIIRDAAAARHLTVAPLHARTHRQGLWGVSRQFAADLFHPNDRGYRVWAAAFEPAVDARLSTLDQ